MQKKTYWYGNENLILSNIISDLTGAITWVIPLQCLSDLKSSSWDSNFCDLQIYLLEIGWKQSILYKVRNRFVSIKQISRLVAFAESRHARFKSLASEKPSTVLPRRSLFKEMLALTALVLLGSTHTHVAFFFHIECLFCCYNLIVDRVEEQQTHIFLWNYKHKHKGSVLLGMNTVIFSFLQAVFVLDTDGFFWIIRIFFPKV